MKQRIIFLFFILLSIFSHAQRSISLVYFDNTKTYLSGGGVSVHFKPNGVYPFDATFTNRSTNFRLQLIRASDSSLLANDIGSERNFFVPMLNGVIPVGTANGSYKIRVIADSANVEISSVMTAQFSIQSGGASSNVQIGSPSPAFTNIGDVGCFSSSNFFGYVNKTVGNTSDVLNFIIPSFDNSFDHELLLIDHNTLTTTFLTILVPGGINPNYRFTIPANLNLGHFTLQFNKTKSGFTSSNSFIYMVNSGGTSLGNTSSENVCVGVPINFSVDQATIEKNYSGSYYVVNYGDGTKLDTFTQARFLTNLAFSHSYSNPTCSFLPFPLGGRFPVKISLFNKGYVSTSCNSYAENGAGTNKSINVSTPPNANFYGKNPICINDSVRFINNTLSGQYGTSSTCLTTANYTWAVKPPNQSTFDDIDPSLGWIDFNNNLNVPKNIFNLVGTWQIRLTARNPQGCTVESIITKDFCVQPQITAAFKFDDGVLKDSIVACAPKQVKIANTTATVACSETTFSWTVMRESDSAVISNVAGIYTYVTGNNNSQNPIFNFTTPGRYLLKLTATNVCNTDKLIRKIIIAGNTGATLPADIAYCNFRTINFDTSIFHHPTYSSTSGNGETVTWTIAPSSYLFVGGTTANSFYPQIQFNANVAYTVQLGFNSNCPGGQITRTQIIRFDEPIAMTIAADKNPTVCRTDATIALNATVNGPANSLVWSPGNGTGSFSTNSNATSTYTFNNTDKSLNPLLLILSATPTAPNVCPVKKDTISVKFTAANTVTALTSKTICSGTSVSQAISSSLLSSTLNWTSTVTSGSVTGNTNGSGTINDVLVNTSTSVIATVKYTITPQLNGCNGTPYDFTVTVNPIPTVDQPADQVVCAGVSTTAINFSGTGTSYSWTNSNTALGLSLPGSTGNIAAYTTVNTTQNTASTTIKVTPKFLNNSVTCSGTEKTFTITVNAKPVIANANPNICSNGSFSVNPSHNGTTNIVPTGTTYKWGTPVSNPLGAITGGAEQLVGAVGPISQTLVNTTNASATLTYTVTPTSGTADNCVGSTFTITVTVNPQAGISNQTTSICSGSSFTVTPTSVPTGTTYTWAAPTLASGLTVTTGNTGNAQTSVGATLTNNTTGALDAIFTVTPSSGGCGSGTFDVTVTVNPKPNIIQQTASICSGASFSITPTSTLVPIGTTYTWVAPTGTGFSGGASSSGSPTTISGTLINTTNTQQTATYSVKPISGAGGNCEGSNFNTVITINPKPVIGNQNKTVCSGEAFSISLVNGGSIILPANTTYTWSAPIVTGGLTGGNNGTNATSFSGNLVNPTNTAQTATYTVTPTSGTTGNCVGTNFTVTVTVNAKPVIGNSNKTICSGSTFSVSPIDGDPNASTIVPAGTTYRWVVPTMPTGVTGGVAQSNQTNITGTLINNTNTPKTVIYTVTPSVGSCDGTTFTVTVIVNPTPKVTAQTREVCSAIPFTHLLTNTEPTIIIPTGTTFSWSAPTGAGFTGGASGTNQTTIDGTLTNSTSTPKTATYSITPTSGADGNCVGTPFNLVVTVNPIPSITTTSSNPNACGSPTGSITINGLVNGVAYTVNYNNALGTPVSTPITASGTQYIIPGLVAGVYTNIRVTSLNCPSNIVASVELKDPTPPTTPVANSVAAVCSGSSITLSVASPIAGTYTWTGPSFNQTTTTGSVVVNTPVTGKYYVSITVASCKSASDSFAVTVNQTPIAPTVTTPITYCQGVTPVSLIANSDTGNTLKWWGNNATGGSFSTIVPTPSTANAGTETFYVSQITTATNCESVRIPIVVTTNVTPLKPTIVTPITYCQGATATALTATPSGSNTIKWYANPTGGSALPSAPLPTTTTIGTTEYYVSQITSFNCEGPRDTIKVVVNETPANPVAPQSIAYCQNATAVALTATALAGNTLKWYPVATGGTSVASITPSTTIPGLTSYYVSQITGLNCESGRTKIDVTINATPSLPTIVTPINYCIGNTPNALTATATSGNTLNWYTDPTGGTASATAPTPTTTNAGTTSYYVSQTTPISFCEGLRAKIDVVVKTTPIIDSVNKSNPTICSTANGTIRIYVKELGNGNYTVNYKKNNNSVTVPSLSANNGVITIQNLFAGTYTDFSVTLDGCPSNVFPGPITLVDPNPPATPTVGSNSPICSGNALNLTSVTTTTGAIQYNWTGPNSFTSTNQNPTINAATTAASGTYSVTATLNSCVSAAGTVVVIVDSTPVAPTIATNSPLCYGSNLTFTTTINFPSTLTYAWTGPNGFTSSIQNPTIPTATELASGTYSLLVTANAGNCSPDTVFKNVIVRPKITQALIAGLDTVFVCNFNPPANATQSIAANTDLTRSFETGKWTIINQPLNGSGSFANDTQPSTSFTYAQSGLYQLQWAITNDVGCPSTKDTVFLSIVDQPQIKEELTSTAINVCAGNPVTISIPTNQVVGAISKWQFKRPYTNSQWQDTAVTNPTITFNNVQDTFSVRLVVIATNQLHCSADTAFKEIKINVAPPSLPGVTSGVDTVCQGNNSGVIVLIGNIGSPFWQSSTNGINYTNTGISVQQTYTYTNLNQTTWFRAAVKSGVCDTVFSNPTKITVFPPVTNANAGADVELCGDSTFQLNANTPSSLENGVWSFASGSPTCTINTPTAANTIISNMIPNTNYKLVWTLSNGICTSTNDEIEIKNYLPLTNIIDTTTVPVCNSVVVSVTGNPPVGGNLPYLYQWQILQGTTWVNIPGANNMDYTFTADTTVKIRRQVIATPCSNFSLEKIIYVQPPLGNNTISGNTETCINTTPGILLGSLPTGADGNYFYQWQILQGTTWTDITTATQKDYTVPILTVTTEYRRLVTSALCSGNQGIYSLPFVVTVRPDAKAVPLYTKDTACAPFSINNLIFSPVHQPLENGSYNWYANNVIYGNNATQNPGYILNNAGDSVIIKMVAVSLYGCKNDSVQHKFFTIPPVFTNFKLSDSVGCGPLSVTLTNTTPYLGFFNYAWNFGNQQTSNLQQPGTIIFQSNPNFTDTTYYVTLTATSECEVVTKTKTVTVKAKPKSIFTPDKTVGCSPLPVTFTNISKGIGATYIWDFGDGTQQAIATPSTVNHTFVTGIQDTFKVKLISINQCGNDTAIYNIVVAPSTLKLDFAVNGTEKQGCKQHTVKFINASSGVSSFQWNFGDGNTLNTIKNIDTVNHTFLQSGTFTVTLFATNGCSDTTATEIIQVFDPPTANFAATPLQACIGDTIHFTNQSDTTTSLLWNFKDGYTSSNSNPVHAYTTAGIYNVQLKAIRQYNSGLACTDSIIRPINIVSKLPGIFSVTDSISNCVPFTATFTNNTLPSSLTVWNFAPGINDTGNIVTHTFTQVGTYVVTMTAKHPTGCTYESTKNIVVRAPSGTITYDNGYICGNLPVRFEATVQNTDSIRWNFGDGSFLTTASPVIYHVYNQSGLYVPTATLTTGSLANCSVLIRGLDTIKVDNLKAGYRYSSLQTCGNTKVQFTDTSRKYLPIVSWRWSFGDGTFSTLQNPVKNYTASNSWQIQLIVTSASGCSDTINKNIYIKVNTIPSANINAALTACTNRPITYEAQYVSADTVSIINWSFSNGVVLTGSPVNNYYLNTGTYTATLIVGTLYGCQDTATKSITINQSPTITASADATICKGQSKQLNVTGTTSYAWSPIDGSLNCITCANPIAKPLTTTFYVVTGTNSFGCTAIDTVVITVAQPINLTVSPNDTICIGQSAQLSVTGATTYTWSPGLTLNNTTTAFPIATPVLTTRYRVIGFDSYNCFQDTAYVTVAVGQYPTVNLGADKVLATGTPLPLVTTVTNGPITKWTWGPTAATLSCNDCPLPIATIKREICYAVEVANLYKCVARDTMCVKVFCENAQVFIPNAFTPDGDGVNDVLMVRAQGIRSVKNFRIFNRWGQLVFEKNNFNPNDISAGWDGTINGKLATPDVYVYMCEVVCENDVMYTYKGNVSIVR